MRPRLGRLDWSALTVAASSEEERKCGFHQEIQLYTYNSVVNLCGIDLTPRIFDLMPRRHYVT